jgi:hypothetical protein
VDAQKTIRDEIQRQARPAKWTGTAAIVLIIALAFVLRSFGRQLSPRTLSLISLGTLTAIVLARLATNALVRRVMCPKCNAILGSFASTMQDSRRAKKINFCPYCAVNLDQPMPEAPTAAENVTTPDKLVWK